MEQLKYGLLDLIIYRKLLIKYKTLVSNGKIWFIIKFDDVPSKYTIYRKFTIL